MKIVPVLILCAALLLAACTVSVPATETPEGQALANTPVSMETLPPRPSITLNAGEETLAGLAGAYCWLQAANDIRCEPDPLDLEPAQAVQVAPGDTLTFSLEGQESIPGAFYAVLLDDADGGEAPRVDFGAVTSAEYEVDLGAGVHRFDVIAEFPDISGDNSFVSYVFAVEVPESMVEAPTETVATPTEAATKPPASATPDEAATEEVTEEPTEAATALAARPTEGAEVEVTDEATEVMVASATPQPPTAAPSPTVPPTPLPPTMAPTVAPTALPTATPQTVPEFGADLPSVVVVNGGQTYVPSGAELCPPDALDDSECESLPASAESARLLVANGDTLRIDLAGSGPASLAVALANNSLTAEINRLELPGSAIVLYTIDAPAGNYVLVVTANWPDAGVATYFFRLQVQS